jgi:hypothetical protein
MWWYCVLSVDALQRSLRSCYSVETELALVALVLLAWQAVRIPLEGGIGVSLEHAEEVLRLEHVLSLDVESRLIVSLSTTSAGEALRWLYTNIHLPVLFCFVAAVRLLVPDRYPAIRTTFAASFVPAIIVIGLYPLAPPHWLPRLGLGVPPSQAELTVGGGLFHNSTAAAASQHFGFAVFVAATSIWLFPRSRLAWVTLAYPVLVFVVIVGTGNHYVLDCFVGAFTFAFGAAVASLVHRGHRAQTVPAQVGDATSVALGYALIAWAFVSFDVLAPLRWENLFPDAFVLAAGVAAVIVPRLGAEEALAESA